jgi:CDP-glucose 4,6-dehydratase
MGNFWQAKRVLITGVNGFLGSHLAIELLKKKAEVIGIIKEVLKPNFLNIAKKGLANPRIKVIKSDVSDLNDLLNIFNRYRPQICLHVAAQPIVSIASESPLYTFRVNIRGTWNILESARISKTKAIVVASSDKVYGEQEKLPYKEDFAILALNPYDISKACADMLTRVFAHAHNLNTAVTRCVNIYGPGDFTYSRIIPGTIRSIILNQDPLICRNDTSFRDYMYIDDAVDAYLHLAEALYIRPEVIRGQAFNFGTGKPISVLNLVRLLIKLSGNNKLRPKIIVKSQAKGAIKKQYLSSQKAKRILGWKAKIQLAEGLSKTLAWYKRYI